MFSGEEGFPSFPPFLPLPSAAVATVFAFIPSIRLTFIPAADPPPSVILSDTPSLLSGFSLSACNASLHHFLSPSHRLHTCLQPSPLHSPFPTTSFLTSCMKTYPSMASSPTPIPSLSPNPPLSSVAKKPTSVTKSSSISETSTTKLSTTPASTIPSVLTSFVYLSEDPKHRPAFSVRAVHVLPTELEDLSSNNESVLGNDTELLPRPKSLYPPPAFGSSPNLEALTLEESDSVDKEKNESSHSPGRVRYVPMHEVTFSTVDKPKLLCELSSLLADIGLNIREAYVFSTVDGFSLDVFVVDGWPTEDTTDLQQALETAIASIEETYYESVSPVSSPSELTTKSDASDFEYLDLLSDGTNDWDIDYNQLIFSRKVASGSVGDLYRGIYGGREVAIKILKPERLNKDMQKEFAQEVYIMRKVCHKNIVQFIGACTRPPNLCIVTEFMSGGSVYDYLQSQKGLLKISTLLRVAIDVSKGMDYLHRNNIIHRDLKAANLLMDENEVVKIADFGVARVQAQGGIMTAETGTYRWMAPEVIEHKPYDQRADVFSFGIVLWELLTGKLPYSLLTPLQAAVAVVQKGLRPTIPKNTHPKLAELLEKCWKQDPNERPEFSEIIILLHDIWREVEDEKKEKKGGFFSVLKRATH